MKAVPLGLYHTHHYDKGGNVDRLKTRATVNGHSGNMTRGIHYSKTFAATPREDTSGILSAKPVMLKKHFVGQGCHPENK